MLISLLLPLGGLLADTSEFHQILACTEGERGSIFHIVQFNSDGNPFTYVALADMVSCVNVC